MARVALSSGGNGRMGWSVDDLSKASGVNRRTILNFENGGPVSQTSIAKLREALEKAGIHFVEKGRLAGAVQLRLRPTP